jgi:transposase-like protein
MGYYGDTYNNCELLAKKFFARRRVAQQLTAELREECRKMHVNHEEQEFQRITPEKRDEALKLLKEGRKANIVARMVGIQARQVYHIIKTHKLSNTTRTKCYPQEFRDDVIRDFEAGKSMIDLAEKYGVHETSIRNWVRLKQKGE